MLVFVLSCKFLTCTCKHKNMLVSMYFLHLVLTFTPHYIILVKGSIKHQLGTCMCTLYSHDTAPNVKTMIDYNRCTHSQQEDSGGNTPHS